MNEEEITEIQMYLMKKINTLRYGYTTLTPVDKLDRLCNLMANWIEFQMEKEKISNKQAP